MNRTLLVGLTALAVQALLLFRLLTSPVAGVQGGDMQFYHEWALRIAHGQWTDHHAFYGLPGYAFLLAGSYRLCGSPETGLRMVLVLQGLLQAGTAVLVFDLARRVIPAAFRGNLAASAAAAAGWVLFVPAQALSVIAMPTIWVIFAFWLSVWSAVRTERTRALWPWAPLGLLVGVVAMLVATILFVLPLLAVSAWQRSSRRACALLVLLAGVGVGTSPAWLHNAFVAHEPAFLSAHGGINFWIGNYPGANGYPKIPEGLRSGQQELLDDSIRQAEEAAGHPLTRPEVSRYWSAKAWAEIRQHPVACVGRLGLKLRAFWNAFSYDDLTIEELLRENGVLLPGLTFGVVAALGLGGMARALWLGGAARWVAAAVLLHMLALAPVFITERYRVTAVPGLLVLAAYAAAWLAETLRQREWPRVAIGTAPLAAGVAVVFLPSSGQALTSMQPYNLAISELDIVDRLSPGEQSERARQLALAREHLETARRYAPENPALLFAFGRYFAESGDRAQARGSYGHCLERDSHYTDAYINLAVMALQEQQWDSAAKLLTVATTLNPHDAGSYYLLARARAAMRDVPGAREAIEQALRLTPGTPAFTQFRDSLGR